MNTLLKPIPKHNPSSSTKVGPSNTINHAVEQSSPLYTPSSPLAPALNSATTPVSPHSTARRSARNTNSLRLANLGRLSHTSQQTTSSTSEAMPKKGLQTSASKHGHSRQYSDAQVALHNFQRELIASASRSSLTVSTTVHYKPLSPKLLPLGSPGPVTPLMLEEEEAAGYLVAGAVRRGIGLEESMDREFVERLVHGEDRRQSPQAERPSAVSPAGGSR